MPPQAWSSSSCPLRWLAQGSVEGQRAWLVDMALVDLSIRSVGHHQLLGPEPVGRGPLRCGKGHDQVPRSGCGVAVRSPPAYLNPSHSATGCTTSTPIRMQRFTTTTTTTIAMFLFACLLALVALVPPQGFGYTAQRSAQRVPLRCGPDQVQHSARAAHRRPDLRPHHRAPNRADLPLRMYLHSSLHMYMFV